MASSRSIAVPLVFLAVILVGAMMMPLFTTMNIPTSDGLTIIESAWKTIRNDTDTQHALLPAGTPSFNVTANEEEDTLFLLEGAGIKITNFFENDTIKIATTGAGGGEDNTGTNVGGQTGQVFRDKTGVTLNFKTISGSGGITITNNANDIDIAGSGGSSALLDGSTHTDTVAQVVSRGSIIIGDSTPDWNELIVGIDNTVLRSDGTDITWAGLVIGNEVTGASTALTDTANIAYLNTPNTYTDGNLQTFTDDDFRFGDNTGGQFYTISTGDIVADRIISLPVLSGNSVFVFTDVGQTLTVKTITLGSNTISGSSAEFDTANTDDNFVYEGAINSWGDGIKQTFNPDTTEVGINIGSHTAEPSSPDAGDIFYDSTAGQFKGYDGAWRNLVGGAGGITTINTDATAAQVFSGTANEIIITDTGAGTLEWDAGTDMVQIDQANTYADGNLQTFTDDDFRIGDSTGGQFYTFSTGDVAADRIVSFPVLVGNSVFVFTDAGQTLTTKTMTLGSNTISGTTAEFNTANTDGTFVVIEVANTYTDGIKQTFNPDATNSGLNLGTQAGEPSSPVTGDLYYDATANQFKGRTNSAWINLGASGGTNALLDGSIHTDTIAQVVSRGSIIIGDATPDWNELIVGGANTVLHSDGTDITWQSISSADLPAVVVETDDINTYSDGIKQTFNPDTTNAGLNIGLFAGEPSSPVEGDIFYDSTANQFKGRDDGAWINLGASGSGITTINSDSASAQVFSGVSNEVIITDTGAGTLDFGVGTDVVQINQANTYVDGNIQTFTDDDIRFQDNTGGQFFTLSTGDIAVDRIISLPVLTGNSVFVFTDAGQTLTTKTITLASNTVSGTSAEFDTANTDGTFFLNADNISQMATSSTAQFNTANSDGTFVTIEVVNTYSDGIKQTFNPDTTNAGLNIGLFAGEPSSPVEGDIFYDSTANQFKGRDDGAWVNLGASGGGTNDLLDGSAHQDTTASSAVQGSLIVGDATPDWTALVVGGADTVLRTDGTSLSWAGLVIGTEVTGASTALTDTANIAYLNTANIWGTGTQDFGSLTIEGFDLNCDGTGNSCTNVDTSDIIGVAQPKLQVFTCGAGMSQVANTPNKRTVDATFDYVVCDFDGTTTEILIFSTIAPVNMDSSGTIDVKLHVSSLDQTDTSCFEVSFISLADSGVISGAFPAGTNACTGTMVSGDVEVVTMDGITSGTHGITAGELVFIEVLRASDANTGDVGLINMEIEWN